LIGGGADPRNLFSPDVVVYTNDTTRQIPHELQNIPHQDHPLMSPHTLAWISLSVGGWALANGILHDIEVIRGHYTEYDRHFLYYLLNGHIIIFSGIFEMISYAPIDDGQVWGLVVSDTAALGMIVYCAMIWKFLPSFLTIVLQSGSFIVLALSYFRIL
jgi:hypothetical protein